MHARKATSYGAHQSLPIFLNIIFQHLEMFLTFRNLFELFELLFFPILVTIQTIIGELKIH